ncbi:MAG: ABC transporter permease [Anaerolineales bacterium]|nr:ABC transporter permease [Anaerolineales bacterium]
MDVGQASSKQQLRAPALRGIMSAAWRNRLRTAVLNRYEYLLIPVSLMLFVGAWQLVINTNRLPEYILPRPGAVWKMFLTSMQGGDLWFHTRYTLAEALAGFALGFVFATGLGYLLGKSPGLEKVTFPVIVAGKAVPIMGIAPLIIIWFGQDILSKALIAFLVIFFPMLVNTIVGIRQVDAQQRELMRSYSASTWQTFSILEVPAALPVLLGGIRVGLARSMMGAIVGEYLGGQRGLGFLINMGTRGGTPNASLVFVGIIAIVVITLVLYGTGTLLGHVLLAGRRRDAK